MNEIRKNLEDEKILIEGKFKLSPGALLVLIFSTLIFGIPLILCFIFAPTMTGEVNGTPASGWAIAAPIISTVGIMFILVLASQILRIVAIKKSQLVVTNKRIYGIYSILVARKNFSYRLDEVDNVEMVSTLGQHTLAIQFTQGHGPSLLATTYVNGIPTSGGYNVLRMSNLKNYKEIMDVLNELITSKKNLVDVQADIEMGKLNAENRKADALENVAKNIAVSSNSNDGNKKSQNYIDELRQLKQLLDEGVITQEEFDCEKKEILDNNHKNSIS